MTVEFECPEWIREKYWALEVGDDPGDGFTKGPFNSFKEAYESVSQNYHLWNKPDTYPTCVGWHSQISSLYIYWSLETTTPTYEVEIKKLLKEKE